MTGDKELFTEEKLTESSQRYITFGDNNKGKVLGLGKVAISKDKHIDKVMLVKSLGFNRMSISKLCDMGMLVLFSATHCVVFSQNDYKFIFEGYRKGDLYIMDFSLGSAMPTCLIAKATEGWLWHRRLGHAEMRNLQTLVKKKHIVGLSEVKFDKDRLRSACEAGKLATKHHSAKTVMITIRPLELLHMDLFGPQNYASFGGNKYGLVIVDDFSRFTWVFFLDDKTKVVEIFKSFAKRAQNEYDLTLKHIRSDNGTEFKNTHIEEFLDDYGITHEFSAANTPQQNGVVERKNRTLIEMSRTMLAEYQAPIRFWANAINTACHIINRVYLHKFLKKTSYELITGNKPNVPYLRLFGAPCYIKDMNHNSKFTPKAHEGFLLGYGSNSHTYRVYNSHFGKVMETVNVRFDETNGSQKEQLPHVLDKPPLNEVIRSMAIGDVRPDETNARRNDDDDNPLFPYIARGVGDQNQRQEDNVEQDEEEPQNKENANPGGNADPEGNENPEENAGPLARVRKRMNVDMILEDIARPGPTTRSRTRLANFCGHFSFVSMLEPSKFDQAMEDPDWIIAMQEELHQFTRNNIWSLVDRPDPKSIISLAQSGFSATSKMKMVLSFAIKPDLLHKATHGLKVLILVILMHLLLALNPFVLCLLLQIIITYCYIKWM